MPPKIRQYTVEYKVGVVEWHRRNGNNVSKTAREFEIDRKRVREWNQNYDKLLLNNVGSAKKKQKLHEGGNPFSPLIDNAVFEFLMDEREEGRCVSNDMLTQKARECAAQHNIQGFKASDGWLHRWKKRYNVGVRQGTNDSQKIPEDYAEHLLAFRRSIIHLRQRHDYLLNNVCNMDQTMVRFDSTPRTTNNVRGEKTIRIKSSGAKKKGCTVALCVGAGGYKYPAYVIFKEPTGQLGPRVLQQLNIPNNVKVSASKNGWMTREELFKWFRRVWKNPEDESVRRLLTLDHYRPHMSEEVNEMAAQRSTDLVFIPAGCTSIAQPLDVSINKPFKDKLKEEWVNWMQTAKTNERGNLRQPTRQNVLNWISNAWENIDEEIVIRSFLRCGISNELDGSQDDLVSDNIPTLDEDDLNEERVHLLLDDSGDEDLDFDGFDEHDL